MSANKNIAEWPYIPDQAFLYFPTGKEIKEGKEEKQWRKIFQDGEPYDQYENKSIDKLNQKLRDKKIAANQWFDNANKLRFLQANKFHIEKTADSIKEASTWRQSSFPLAQNSEVLAKLNQGVIYFCGRDKEYRPILVAQVTRMREYSEAVVKGMLNNLLQFCFQNLMVPGQVENYVLIINLDDAGWSDKSSIQKLLSFTSNTYRSRLFASYLLNTPSLIQYGWNGLASNFVSENTLKKIKISNESSHKEMWTHIDKEIIQRKYDGLMPNIQSPFWPPNKKLMNYVSKIPSLKLIRKDQYNKRLESGKLQFRRIKENLIEKKKIETNSEQSKTAQRIPSDKKFKQGQSNKKIGESVNKSKATQMHSPRKSISINVIESLLPKQKIKIQAPAFIIKRTFTLFFEDEKFKQILSGK